MDFGTHITRCTHTRGVYFVRTDLPITVEIKFNMNDYPEQIDNECIVVLYEDTVGIAHYHKISMIESAGTSLPVMLEGKKVLMEMVDLRRFNSFYLFQRLIQPFHFYQKQQLNGQNQTSKQLNGKNGKIWKI